MFQKKQKQRKKRILKKMEEVVSSTMFENLLLSSRNQVLLKKCAFEICREKKVGFPRTIVHYLLYYSIKFLEDKVSEHKFSNKKLSFLNCEILTKFYEDLENHLLQKSYWLKKELEKSEKLKNKEIEKQKEELIQKVFIENNKKEELQKKKAEEILMSKYKKAWGKNLSDLYNYS